MPARAQGCESLLFVADEIDEVEDDAQTDCDDGQGRGAGPWDCATATLLKMRKLVRCIYGGTQCAL